MVCHGIYLVKIFLKIIARRWQNVIPKNRTCRPRSKHCRLDLCDGGGVSSLPCTALQSEWENLARRKLLAKNNLRGKENYVAKVEIRPTTRYWFGEFDDVSLCNI